MRTMTVVAAVAISSLLPLALSAQELQPVQAYSTKEAFLERWKDKAVEQEPGVWLVEPAPGVRMRATFGVEGKEAELRRLRERLDRLELRLVLQGPSEQLEKQAAQIRGWLERLDPVLTPVANKVIEEGGICNDGGARGGYLMEGALKTGSSGAYAWAYSEAGLDLDFGPPPPYYENRYSGVNVYTRHGRRFCGYASDSDSITTGAIGLAISQAQLPCSLCAWATESYAQIEGCADSFRALYVSSGDLSSCYY